MLQDLLQRLEERIEPEIAQAISGSYELRFVGEDLRGYLDFNGAAPWVSTTTPSGKYCSLGLHLEDLADLLEGRVNLKVLFSTGRLRVFGDVGEAMKLENLF